MQRHRENYRLCPFRKLGSRVSKKYKTSRCRTDGKYYKCLLGETTPGKVSTSISTIRRRCVHKTYTTACFSKRQIVGQKKVDIKDVPLRETAPGKLSLSFQETSQRCVQKYTTERFAQVAGSRRNGKQKIDLCLFRKLCTGVFKKLIQQRVVEEIMNTKMFLLETTSSSRIRYRGIQNTYTTVHRRTNGKYNSNVPLGETNRRKFFIFSVSKIRDRGCLDAK
jgi:hypothetical protein